MTPKKLNRLGSTFALFHIALVIYVVTFILNGVERDWPLYWLLFLLLDFPVCLIEVGVNCLIFDSYEQTWIPTRLDLVESYSPLNDVVNFWMPLLIYGVIGTVWWFIIPRIIQQLAHFFKRR